ncbi:TPA: RNA polymerase subunit sigma [Candidatus Latescibacteria bacterium]|nr:RNA polymerase subunit sigma [Candidatus Latescibacterota bacterium]
MRSLISDAASAYMESLSRYPVMSAEEFDRLILLAKKGDLEAKNRIVQGNLRFVVQIAGEYQTGALPFADLLAEGNIGLIKAVDKFDPSLGYRFSTYAVWWIRNAIQRAIRHHSQPFRLPHNRFDDLSKLQNSADRMSQEAGRAVSPNEAAEMLDMNRNRTDLALGTQNASVSIDGLADDEERSLHNILPDERCLQDETLFQGEIKERLELVMQNLNARDAEIITLTFGLKDEPMTLTQVGTRFGISKERVRQIRNRAMLQLKTLLLDEEDLSAAYV